ncbi:MAG: disulfide reductase [Acidobacteria bacterium RBG_16_68_9]|nr:MAG: disulfide reductase [Acidobacteria bacterium RBG_16_68_9]
MSKIGVFVCHCGENIARTVQVQRVVEFAKHIPGVAVSTDYPYLCSAPGQKIVTDAIQEHGLDGVVVAACSPQLHEPTFRAAAAHAGLNPYRCEIANIREHCSWVHADSGQASVKACEIVAAAAERTKQARSLDPVKVPVTKRALVIGGGVAGIRSALDMANAGHEVVLVEREASLGGNMARLSETFPTLDCSQCILTPLMVQVLRHPKIELLTYAEVAEVGGYVGNFKVRIRKKPRYVIADRCTACGDCAPACPSPGGNDFDMALSTRKAIYIPFPQAVPSTYTLDADRCLNAKLESPRGWRVLACVRCQVACLPNAIDFDMQPEIVEREVGAIVVATGFTQQGGAQAERYGLGRHPDVLYGLEFERMLSASGPTGGEPRRPSDGRTPKSVVFIQCVDSRNPEHGVPYCSSICCMYTAKHALLLTHKVPDAHAYVFFMDIRAGGKGYEEFVQRVREEERVVYIRGRVGHVIERDGKLLVRGVDTLSGKRMEVEADMIVLATPVEAADHGQVASLLRIAADSHGFLREAHPKLRPVETLTAGIFLAGTAQGPKDIPAAVSQASAAASKGLELLSQELLQRDPTTAHVDERFCAGCFDCLQVCPYHAIEKREIRDRQGSLLRLVASANPAMCEGCGLCTVTCRGGCIDLDGYTDEQVFAQLSALTRLPEAVAP